MPTRPAPLTHASPTSDNQMALPDGRTLGWTQSGDRHGAPLLWFHGSPSSRLDAAPGGPYSDALTAAGVRLIGFDRPGYGLSTSHPDRTLLTVAGDVAALADALELDRFAVAGWSGGGPMALATAALLGSRVTGVALLASIAPAALVDATDLAEAALFSLAGSDPAALTELLGGLAQLMRDDPLGAAWQMLGEHLAETDLTAVSDPAYAAAMAASLGESARQDLLGYAQDLAGLAASWPFTCDQVHQSVVLVHGRADRIVPLRHGQALAAALPDAALQTTDDGHLSVIAHLPALATTLLGSP